MHLRFLLLLLFLFAGSASAQTGDTLRILRVDTGNFPTVRIHVRAFCGGQQTSNVNPITVQVVDGLINRTFTLRCPPATTPMSVGLVLDRSNSMSGTPWYRLQEAVRQFITLFQTHPGGSDEAALIVFNEIVELASAMTPNKNDLINILANTYPFGNTALWDGVMMGLYQVATTATNATKAVIVFTDGGDNSSLSTLGDVIAYAQAQGIPVYVVGLITYAKQDEIQALKILAESTGGFFIPLTHPNDIIPIFNALASIITGGMNDCVIEYQSECADGSLRTAVVTADICGKIMTQRVTYRVPVDPSLPAARIEFGAATGYANGDLYVPVLITPVGSQATITDIQFKVLERQPLKFLEAIYKPHFGKNFFVNTRVVVDSLIVQLNGVATLTAPDTLMVLRYHANDPQKDTTLPFLLFFVDKKTQQCMRLEVQNAQYTILQRPSLQLSCQDSLLQVSWNTQKVSYDPEVVRIAATIRNNGPKLAGNPVIWIKVPYGMTVFGPESLLVASPGLASGSSTKFDFDVRITPVDSVRDFTVCISIKPDSGFVSTCCTRITVERGKPALRMWCDLPREIRWVDSLQSFYPPEFPVTVNIVNVSPVLAQAAEAWIHLPDGFELSGTTPINTVPVPSTLAQSDTGRVMWMLRPKDRMTSDSLEFCIKTSAGLDTAVCCSKVYITSSPVRASLACTNPRVIKYDEQTGKFEPPQFIVSTMVRNTSGNPMSQARGGISFPSYLALAPGETVFKNLPNGAVVQPGDSVQVMWVLQGKSPPTGNSQICIDIMATNFPGDRCCIPLFVETSNAIPILACSLSGPDTIRYTENGYVPNPMTVRVRVDNLGTTPAKGVYSALLQGADLSIAIGDQALKLVSDSLPAGDSVESQFLINVLDRSVSRFDTVRVSVYASNGGGIVCEKRVYIEAVRGPKLELTCRGPDSLVFVDSLNGYSPSPFTISMTATNTGTATADSVVAEFLVPPNIELAQGDQAVKFLTPMTLAVSQSGTVSWQVNALSRTFPRMDTLRVQARIKGKVPLNAEPCPIHVFVPAARKAILDVSCSPIAELTVVGDRFSPDPFGIRLRIRNNGDAQAFDITASVLSFGRLQLAAGETPVKYQTTLSAQGGETEFQWFFTATPLTQGDSVEVCFRVSSRFGNDLFCCTKIYLPPLSTGSIATSCSVVDTVRINPATGQYPNPVVVSTRITNPTSVVVDSVRATIILPSGTQLATGESSEKSVYSLAPQQSVNVLWNVNVLRDTSTVLKKRTIRIQYIASGEVQHCEVSLVVVPPPPANDTSRIQISCLAPDSIRFINSQIGLQPNPFTVTVEMSNTGTLPVGGIAARIELPPGITLATGETATKALGFDLQPGKRASFAWSCVPGVGESTRTLAVRVLVDAVGLQESSCERTVVIEGVVRIVRLTIPKGNIARLDQTVTIPVLFTNPDGAVITQFRFDIEFDPTVAKFERVLQEGTLTALWNPLIVTQNGSGAITVSGSNNLSLTDAGTLFRFMLRTVSGDGTENPFGVKVSELRIERPAFPEGVRVEMENGDLVTSGDCVVPLNASERFVVHPSRPNPFNPTTTISYEVPPSPDGITVTIDVLDMFGRTVRRLEKGRKAEGLHEVRFDAGTLPAGVYFYRFLVEEHALWGKMVLTK